MSFSLLFVCTGNICRSPMAQWLFIARTDPALPVLAASAGTSGLAGWPMDLPSARVLHELGGDGGRHLGRRLSPELVGAADLVLTAEIEHRSAITDVDPRAAGRAFTLREFGRLGAGLGPLPQPPSPDGLRNRVAEVAQRRASAPPGGPRLDDIADPYGARFDRVQACGTQISAAVDALIDALGLRRAGPAAAGATP